MKRKKWVPALSLVLVFGLVLNSSPAYVNAMELFGTEKSEQADTEQVGVTNIQKSETESKTVYETESVTETGVDTEPVSEAETEALIETESATLSEPETEQVTEIPKVKKKAKKAVKRSYEFSEIRDFESLMNFVYQYDDGEFYTWMTDMSSEKTQEFQRVIQLYDQEDSVMSRYDYLKKEIDKIKPSIKLRSSKGENVRLEQFLASKESTYASISTGAALRNALESTKNQGLINLTENVNFGGPVTINNTCTLKGKNLAALCSDKYGWFITIAKNKTFTIENQVYKNSNTDYKIGGVYVPDGATLLINPTGVIASFKMDHNGAGVRVEEGGILHHNGKIFNCVAGMMGGGIYNKGSAYMYEGAEIYNCKALCDNMILEETAGGGGGGITTDNKFIMYGGMIRNCTSVYLGGGARNNGVMEMRGGSIHDNTAEKNGGGVYSGLNKDSQFKMSGGEIYNNKALGIDEDGVGGDGGGIKCLGYAAKGGGNSFTGGSIYNNMSIRGGGIYSRGDVTIDGVDIHDNTATNGAGVYIYSNTTTIKSGFIRNNKTIASGQGGGIYSKAHVVMTGGTIANNTSEGSAGGILIAGYSVTNGFNDIGTFTMSGGTISGNTTGGVGAGVYQVGEGASGYKPFITFSGGSIHGNVGGGGYGIFNNSTVGTVSLSDGASMGFTAWKNDESQTLSSNGIGNIYNKGILNIKATDAGYIRLATGGGFNIYNASTGTTNIYSTGTENHYAVLTGNKGIGILNEGMLAMSSGRILMAAEGIRNQKTATISGGSIYKCSSHGIYNRGTSALLTLSNVDIHNNTGTGAGAGIANDAGTVTMNSGKVYGNTAANGGGIYNGKLDKTGGIFNLNGGSVFSNKAALNGGGVYNADGAVLKVRGADIYSNIAASAGGGIANYGSADMTGGRIRLNSSANGGGIQNSNTFSLSGGTIGGHDASNNSQGNRSSGHGGGIRNDKNFSFLGGTISYNTAVYNGGGIFSGKNNSLTITGGTVDSNRVTTGNGGGITVAVNTADLVIRKCTITNNIAENGDNGYGGGLYSEANTLLYDNNISQNSAGYGGGVFMNGADCSLNSGSVNGNTSTKHGGGGVYVIYNTLYVNGGTINGNIAEKAGGGAAAFGGFIEVNGGSITNNSAKTNGGGLYAEDGGKAEHSEAKITFSKGTIKGNTAALNGGGIYTRRLAEGEIKAASGESADLSMNTAGEEGGGIYAENAFKMINCAIKKNKAVDGAGIYGTSASTVTLTSGIVTENIATGKGGGVFVGGSMQSAAGELSNNNAKEGGGLYIGSKGSADIGSCKVKSNAAVSGAGAFNEGTLIFGRDTLIQMNKASSNGGAAYNNGTIIMNKGMIGTNVAAKGKSIYQNGTLNISAEPVIQEEIFLTPEHFITVTKSGCTTAFITAMDEADTFDGRVLANYINMDSGQISKYSLETVTKGVAKTKGIDIVDKMPERGTYPYQVLLEGEKVLIEYNGNPARGDESKITGSVPSDIVPISELYTIRDNGYSYQRHSFTGWSKYTYDNGKMFQPGNQIRTESSFADIWNPLSPLNKSKMKIANQVSVRSLVEAYGVPISLDENIDGVKYKVDLYAIWDEAPTIDTVSIEFYEGEKVLGKQLKDGLRFSEQGATDYEDGVSQKGQKYFPHLLDDKTNIRKITYNSLKNGYIPSQFLVEFATDVPADTFYLDTYSGKGMVKDEVVVNKLTFQVEDSKGNITEKVSDVRINYNNFPTLKVPENLILTTAYLRANPLTNVDLLKYAKANDIEDDAAKLQGTIYEGKLVNIQNRVTVVSVTDKNGISIQPEYIHDTGDYFVNYGVTDRFGKETLKTMKVTSVEPALLTPEDIKFVRYISLKYLDTLDESSKWDKEELKKILLNEIPQKTYKFTYSQVLEIKELMKGLRSKGDFEGVIQDIIRNYF